MDKKKSELASTLRTATRDRTNNSAANSDIFSSVANGDYKRSSSTKNESRLINKLSDKFKINRNSFVSPKKDLIKSRKKEFADSCTDKETEYLEYGASSYSMAMTMPNYGIKPINQTSKTSNGVKKSSDNSEGKGESKAMQMLEKMREKANQQNNNELMFGLVQPKQKVK